jgi:3',5'-cyclic AMP phosphodiesterase CpdA
MTLIHQVTDIHIPIAGDMSVRENFLQLMAYSSAQKPDLLAITGDLPGEDGSREAYEWIKASLPQGIDTVIIPGNHDDVDSLFDIFESSNNSNPNFLELITLDEIDVMFVNTASSKLPDDQIQQLSDADIRPGSVLFIHHPTKELSGGFMDANYPLLNRDEVDAAIADSQFEHVFCGHYHTDFEIHDDYHLYVTPSPAFDVDRDSLKPKIGPPRIPLREIVVDGTSVSSQVIYLDEP